MNDLLLVQRRVCAGAARCCVHVCGAEIDQQRNTGYQHMLYYPLFLQLRLVVSAHCFSEGSEVNQQEDADNTTIT